MLAGMKKIKDKLFGEIDDPGPDLDFALDFLSKNASDRNSEMETFIDNMILMIERKPRKAIPILSNRIKSQPGNFFFWRNVLSGILKANGKLSQMLYKNFQTLYL